MKKIKFLFISILLFVITLVPVSADYNSSGANAKNFNVEMNVSEEGVITIKERLTLDFFEPRQGFYVTIPQENRVTFDGETKTYFWPVENFRVISNDTVVQTDDSRAGKVYRFGDQGRYITGEKIYEYSYEVHMRDIKAPHGQLFYYNILSETFEFPIESVDFKINLPKEFDIQYLKMYATRNNLDVDYKVDGTTISGSYKNPLFHQGISIHLEVPNGYFTFPTFNYTLPVGIAVSAVLVGVILLYFLFGRDLDVVESVEFEAPDGISSAEVGYIYRGHVKTNDIVSLIVYWASKGFLMIEELDENGSNLRLIKVKELETENDAERKVFNALFRNRDEVTTDKLNETFGKHVQSASMSLMNRFKRDKSMKIFDTKASFFKVLSAIILPLSMGLFTAAASIETSGYSGDFLIGLLVGGVAFLIATVIGVITFVRDGINAVSNNRLTWMVNIPVLAIVYIVVVAFSEMSTMSIIYFTIVFVIFILALIATANMGRRTKVGSRYYGQILGLKRFIEVAEEDRIRTLAEETPELFYNVLPYAYVLGITNTWIKRFEHIAIDNPDWYQTYGTGTVLRDMYIWNNINRSLSTLNHAMTSVPASKGSSGGGSFGGGFGGGGGYGGGGFGGSGGGTW